MESTTPNEKQIESLDTLIKLLRSNIKTILKTGPVTIGFTLFLIYFCQNQFFPSFDLFSLGSLLIAASIFGLGVFTLISLGISAPGLFWVDIFLKDREVDDDFSYSFAGNEETKKKSQLAIVRCYFLLPVTLCGLLNIYLIISDNVHGAYFFGAPLAICILLAIGLKFERKLSASSLFKFVLASTLAFGFANLVSLIFCILAIKAHAPNATSIEETAIAVSVTLAMSMTFSVCAASFKNIKHSHTIFFSMLFAFFLSMISNIWLTLPESIVKILGIGNYTALEIHFNGEPCKVESIEWSTKNEDTCSLNNAKIIWSLGDTYRIRTKANNAEIDLNIPAKHITTIVKTLKEQSKINKEKAAQA